MLIAYVTYKRKQTDPTKSRMLQKTVATLSISINLRNIREQVTSNFCTTKLRSSQNRESSYFVVIYSLHRPNFDLLHPNV